MTTKLTCPANKKGDVLVSWTASSTAGVTGYQVTRSVNGATPVVIASLGATSRSYDDTAVTGSTTYTYGVAATLQSWASSAVTSPPVTTLRKC